MEIDPAELDLKASYRFLSGAVVPRPIAWVLSGADGHLNLAPFSCFTFVSYSPMLLGFNCGLRNGEVKDTAQFVSTSEEFVVHIPSETDLDAVNLSSAPRPMGWSEIEECGLETSHSTKLSIPRLTAPKIAMECKLERIIEFGNVGSQFIVGEVVAIHLADDLLRDGKYIESVDLQPLARVAGPNYAQLGAITAVTPLDTNLAMDLPQL